MASKHMLMTFGDRTALSGKSPDWIKGMIDFMKRIDVELTQSGELAFQQGLADASEARTVRAPGGDPAVTDGPFVAPRESLAGFWIVDVDSEARAIAIADTIATAADAAIEVRACRSRGRRRLTVLIAMLVTLVGVATPIEHQHGHLDGRQHRVQVDPVPFGGAVHVRGTGRREPDRRGTQADRPSTRDAATLGCDSKFGRAPCG